jgi:hypothetical protein
MTKERFSTLTLGRWYVANLALGLEFLEKNLNHYDLKGGGCRNDI